MHVSLRSFSLQTVSSWTLYAPNQNRRLHRDWKSEFLSPSCAKIYKVLHNSIDKSTWSCLKWMRYAADWRAFSTYSDEPTEWKQVSILAKNPPNSPVKYCCRSVCMGKENNCSFAEEKYHVCPLLSCRGFPEIALYCLNAKAQCKSRKALLPSPKFSVHAMGLKGRETHR